MKPRAGQIRPLYGQQLTGKALRERFGLVK
jgi:hypothetical protein